MNLEKMPSGLFDAKLIVDYFPYKFCVDFTGNEFCEDLIRVWNHNFYQIGFAAALDALDAAKASYDVYPIGNFVQRWLTERWLAYQLAR